MSRRSPQRRPAAAALALAVTFAAVLSACSSPDPVLFTIATAPGSVQPRSPRVVLVQQISVAHFLERSQIVRSSENYRLDVMSNDWWGEPLAPMLNRVLVEELGQRLPQSTVIADNGAVTARPDATVEDQHPAPRRGRRRQSRPAGSSRGPSYRSEPAGAAQLPLFGAALDAGRAGRGRCDQRRGGPARRWRRRDVERRCRSARDKPPPAPCAWTRRRHSRNCANARGAGCCSRSLSSILAARPVVRAARRSCAGSPPTGFSTSSRSRSRRWYCSSSCARFH